MVKKLVFFLQHGYCLDFKIVKDGILHKAVESMLVKVIACLETHNSGILQHIIPGTQTFKKVKTNNRFKYSEQSFACTNFQD